MFGSKIREAVGIQQTETNWQSLKHKPFTIVKEELTGLLMMMIIIVKA